MITTVRTVMEALRALGSNTIIDFPDDKIAIIQQAKLGFRKISASEIYQQVDAGIRPSEVARRLNTSRQVVNWALRERDRIKAGIR